VLEIGPEELEAALLEVQEVVEVGWVAEKAEVGQQHQTSFREAELKQLEEVEADLL
jgi:hypothetical protein